MSHMSKAERRWQNRMDALCAQITVACLDGTCFEFANEGWRVDRLKSEISKISDFEAREQRLLYQSKMLRDDEVLPSGNVEITLLRRVRHPRWFAWMDVAKTGNLNDLCLPGVPEGIRADADIILVACRRRHPNPQWCSLSIATEELRDDETVVLAAVRQRPHSLRLASDRLKANVQIVLAAVRTDPFELRYAAEEMRSNHAVARDAVQKKGRALALFDECVRDDRAVALAAVRECADALEFVGEVLREDAAVILAAVAKSASAFQFAGPKASSTRSLVLNVLKVNGRTLQFVQGSFRIDPEVVLVAVAQNAEAYQFADVSLRSNIAFAREAVSHNAHAIKHCGYYCSDPALIDCATRFFCSEIYSGNIQHLNLVPETLRGQSEIVEAMISKLEGWLPKFGQKLHLLDCAEKIGDREAILRSIARDASVFASASAETRMDPEFVLAAVREQGMLLQHAVGTVRSDRRIVLAAVSSDGLALQFASDALRADYDIVKAAVRNDRRAKRFGIGSAKFTLCWNLAKSPNTYEEDTHEEDCEKGREKDKVARDDTALCKHRAEKRCGRANQRHKCRGQQRSLGS